MFQRTVRDLTAAGLLAVLLCSPSRALAQKDAETKPPDLKDLKLWEKKIFPGDLQKKMAESPEADEVLWQTRLDRVYFDIVPIDGKPTRCVFFTGTCLNGERKKPPETDPNHREKGKVRGQVEEKLRKLFADTYGEMLTKAGVSVQVKLHDTDFVVLGDAEHPTRVLQNAASQEARKGELDGTLFAFTRFDAAGQLLLDGLFASTNQAEELKKVNGLLDELSAIAEKKPLWLKLPAWSRATGAVKLNFHSWAGEERSAIAMLQKNLAEKAGATDADKELCRQTRVNRLAFAYDGNTRACTLDVQCLHPGLTALKAEEELKKFLAPICEAIWTKVAAEKGFFKAELGSQVKIPAAKVFALKDHPTRVLQAETRKPNVAAPLDGTLFANAHFNAHGQLVLDGLLGKAEHLDGVRNLLKALPNALQASRSWLTLPKWALELSGNPEPWMLHFYPWDMAEKSALAFLRLNMTDRSGTTPEEKDLCQQTNVHRVYFEYVADEAGVENCFCRIEALCIYASFTPELKRKLEGILSNLGRTAWTRVATKENHFFRSGIKADAAFAKDHPTVEKDPVIALQNEAANDARLDGTMLVRAIFDKGSLKLSGFLNDETQKKLVQDLVDRLYNKKP